MIFSTPAPGDESAHPPCASCTRAESPNLPHNARLVELDAIAEWSAVSIRTVRTWVSAGRLPVVRIGRTVRVRVSDWIDFLDRMRAS